MLKKGDWTAALSVEKRMYLALSEVLETTESMLDAVERQDQVSVRMYLNMRQEQVNQLRNCKDMLRKQCGALPKADGDLLRQVLSGGPAGDPEGRSSAARCAGTGTSWSGPSRRTGGSAGGWGERTPFTAAKPWRKRVEKRKPSAGLRPAEGT